MPRVFDEPVAEPRGAAGGRSITSSSAPNARAAASAPKRIPHFAKTKGRRRPAAAAPPRRPERVAPLTDAAIAAAPNRIERKWNWRRRPCGGPSGSRCRPRARESMDKEEERASPPPSSRRQRRALARARARIRRERVNAGHFLLIVQCRQEPYLNNGMVEVDPGFRSPTHNLSDTPLTDLSYQPLPLADESTCIKIVRTGQQSRQALEPLRSGHAPASALDRRSIRRRAPCRCPQSAGAGIAAC